MLEFWDLSRVLKNSIDRARSSIRNKDDKNILKNPLEYYAILDELAFLMIYFARFRFRWMQSSRSSAGDIVPL